MSTALQRRNRPRRGVTLVEMLVVVALVVLMMVILVQIFQSALGAMSASRTNQELDVTLRAIDSMIRTDLANVTAKMTPPNDPALKQGYFEYGENAPADAQGEDTDDYLAFTTLAPEGQSFTGRQWLSPPANQAIQPITITSQAAEVIYFLRNGNLYRRVFLVAPDKAKSITLGLIPPASRHAYATTIFGGSLNVSWQGMNDISCRPPARQIFDTNGNPTVAPIPNDLGDLTNRENRAFRPRFSNDFLPLDGIPDDNNADGVNDYYPTLYYDGMGNPYQVAGIPIWSPNSLTQEVVGYPTTGPARVAQGVANVNAYSVYAFPFIFPGMYSVPDGSTVSGTNVTPPGNSLGWRHGMLPGSNSNGTYVNHSPLKIGDNLPLPGSQTWWGFPTWRETMTVYTSTSSGTMGWADPVYTVNSPFTATSTTPLSQPLGLTPFPPGVQYSLSNPNFLTPLAQIGSTAQAPFSDGAGSSSFVSIPGILNNQPLNNHLWEDDLILTNVRSFDVKAYDPNAPLYNIQAQNGSFTFGPFAADYQDLGYAYPVFGAGWTSTVAPNWQPNGVPLGFGHEGRMPPIRNDFRLHPRRPTYVGLVNNTPTVLPYNVGDDHAGVTRLVHTFDTWSTAYTNAPDSDILLNGYSVTGLSLYPSYPAPYPSPLRGIQIQIRITDPRNERTKSLTIRHDFTDKL